MCTEVLYKWKLFEGSLRITSLLGILHHSQARSRKHKDLLVKNRALDLRVKSTYISSSFYIMQFIILDPSLYHRSPSHSHSPSPSTSRNICIIHHILRHTRKSSLPLVFLFPYVKTTIEKKKTTYDETAVLETIFHPNEERAMSWLLPPKTKSAYRNFIPTFLTRTL